MTTITLHSHVGSDGVLDLKVPIDLKNTDLEVTVTIKAIPPKLDRDLGVDKGWPEAFFAETAGSIPDLERPPQGDYDLREAL
ncbi:MAG: hypothetical protein KME35_19115 [Aphanocapsa sp. GSE-SYN-MK-11-07L]|jgi:hypothetical protein|nr:hypothetical protein [Aphanocapsa sp. GSE-SYN-MK-11-07L]